MSISEPLRELNIIMISQAQVAGSIDFIATVIEAARSYVAAKHKVDINIKTKLRVMSYLDNQQSRRLIESIRDDVQTEGDGLLNNKLYLLNTRTNDTSLGESLKLFLAGHKEFDAPILEVGRFGDDYPAVIVDDENQEQDSVIHGYTIRLSANSTSHEIQLDGQEVDSVAADLDELLREWIESELGVSSSNEEDLQLEDIPSQSSGGQSFKAEQGLLRIVDLPPNQLIASLDQQEGHAEIRKKATDLLEFCRTRNSLAKLRDDTATLLEKTGLSLSDLKVRGFWSEMNRLRFSLVTYERARASEHVDDDLVPEQMVELLHDLVDELNVFSSFEPILVDLDIRTLDPAERVATKDQLRAAAQLGSSAAASQQVVVPESRPDVAGFAADVSKTGDDPATKRARNFSFHSIRNLALAAIQTVYSGIKAEARFGFREVRGGVYKGVGTSIQVIGLGTLIVMHHTAIFALIGTLPHNSALYGILEAIMTYFHIS